MPPINPNQSISQTPTPVGGNGFSFFSFFKSKLFYIILGVIILGLGIFGIYKLGFLGSSQIISSFSGTIIGQDSNYLNGVNISTKDIKMVSDELGYYSIRISGEKTKSAKSVTVTFVKEGFVPIHKLVSLHGQESTLDIQMFPEQKFEKVDPAQAIKTEMAGASLSSEANSFVIKGTSNKATTANISLTPFDPANEVDVQAFPGDFEGVQMDGTTTAIESFGFMKVQVKDDEGKALDLADGKTAEIKMPISLSQKDSSPSSIPLWYFDPVKGTWMERGTATKFCR
jgi:hypothetical protein